MKTGNHHIIRGLRRGIYNGHTSPFGAQVDFMLPPTNVRKKDKESDHAPNTKVGIFLGWKLQGGRWKGEYKVALLDDFKSVDLKTGAGLEKVRVFITEDVKWHPSNPIKYPLQENMTGSVKPSKVSESMTQH